MSEVRALVGPGFAVGATGYTFDGEPTSDPDQAYYQWAIAYVGPEREPLPCDADPPTSTADDATQRLRMIQLPDKFVSMIRLQRSTSNRVLLVHERAAWPRRYTTTADGRPFPEDGLVAVTDPGERFVCWHLAFSSECRWWPAGLPLRPLDEQGGQTWADLLAQVGPLTVIGYEQPTAEFEG